MFRKIISYFIQGIIIVVPLVGVFFVGKYLWDLVDSAIPIFDNTILNFVSVLFILLSIILTVGFLAASVFAQPFFIMFEELLNRAPIFKFVYSSIKDLMEAFVGEKKRFNSPVLINLINETHLQRFGFVTERDLNRIGPDFKDKVAVYIPMSYSVSGNLFIIPADLVTPLPDVDPAELMKFILAGGVTDLKDVLKDKTAGKASQNAEKSE